MATWRLLLLLCGCDILARDCMHDPIIHVVMRLCFWVTAGTAQWNALLGAQHVCVEEGEREKRVVWWLVVSPLAISWA